MIASLPPNVLTNEQLTPIRSQIHARTGFLPHNIARNVDFSSADRTALAVHIAARYPRLAGDPRKPSGAVAEIVAEIIDSRKAKAGAAGIPIPPHDAQFQRYWRTELERRESIAPAL